jgi:hypothetical protein
MNGLSMGVKEVMSSEVHIPLSEVDFHPLSFADPNGRLFWWQGQLYRGINQRRINFYNSIVQDGVVQSLVDKGLLVETQLTDLKFDEYKMIFKHHCVPFVAYPYEWCAAMLKDAALLVIDLEIELASHDLTLQDAHGWNVLFDGCRPVYTDFCSIVPAPKGENRLWHAYDEFCRFFIYPLYLMAHGHGRIARWLLHDREGILKTDFAALMYRSSLGFETNQVMRKLLSIAKQQVPNSLRPLIEKSLTFLKSIPVGRAMKRYQSRHDFMQQVRQEIEAISIPSVKTEWSDYYKDDFPPFSPSDSWTAKHHSVYQILSNLNPHSVLDIGSNRGWYAQLAALLGINVVAFDVDDVCITQLFCDAKKKGLPVLPLIMDFQYPSPGYGLCNSGGVPAMQRLKCDMVIALALVHHCVFKYWLNFDQIVEGLSVFANKWLLVEFIPSQDGYVREWWSESYTWYTLGHFQEILQRYYRSIRVLPSSPAPRVLLLCEK